MGIFVVLFSVNIRGNINTQAAIQDSSALAASRSQATTVKVEFNGFEGTQLQSGIISSLTPASLDNIELLVYPSPAPNFDAHAGFRVIGSGDMPLLTLICYDMNGKIMFEHEFIPSVGYNKIALKDLPGYQPGSGAYLLGLYNDGDMLDSTWFGVTTE